MKEIELTILMPCLNEAETVALCVEKARGFLRRAAIGGEVVVADNGSSDGSRELAVSAGARVVKVAERGYGAALIGGIREAKGHFIIMGDADDSYDFSALDAILAALRAGNDLVMGNRFRGGIEKGAMPFLHRYLGNPVLSFLGRLFFRTPINDFHCGLRGFSREAILKLRLNAMGMEFASEMVVKSALHGLRIAEVPVKLSPDGRSRPPHLRTWRDGWRHLRFLLLFSPRWLFLIPGVFLFVIGIGAMAIIGAHIVILGGLGLDIHTLAYAGSAVVLGFQMVLFAIFAKFAGQQAGWLPRDIKLEKVLVRATLESGLCLSLCLFLAGLGLTAKALTMWSESGFGALDPRVTMRWVVPSVTLLALAGEVFLGAFFLEALRLSGSRRGIQTMESATIAEFEKL
jgi:glycosyltransferase involved in cell wall biosynthesis